MNVRFMSPEERDTFDYELSVPFGVNPLNTPEAKMQRSQLMQSMMMSGA
jgi:hypothetical protein